MLTHGCCLTECSALPMRPPPARPECRALSVQSQRPRSDRKRAPSCRFQQDDSPCSHSGACSHTIHHRCLHHCQAGPHFQRNQKKLGPREYLWKAVPQRGVPPGRSVPTDSWVGFVEGQERLWSRPEPGLCSLEHVATVRKSRLDSRAAAYPGGYHNWLERRRSECRCR